MREAEFKPEPTDMVLAIRDGVPVITTPLHESGPVPEDFLVLLGIATTFSDPHFRRMMLAICAEASEQGFLDGIIESGRRPDERIN